MHRYLFTKAQMHRWIVEMLLQQPEKLRSYLRRNAAQWISQPRLIKLQRGHNFTPVSTIPNSGPQYTGKQVGGYGIRRKGGAIEEFTVNPAVHNVPFPLVTRISLSSSRTQGEGKQDFRRNLRHLLCVAKPWP